jgi:hypothetical protein
MKNNNRGQVLVLMALAIVALLALAALGIDVGYVYTVRHELQRCADAGALAGASAFRDNGKDSTDPTTRAIAEARAREYAKRDLVIRTPLSDPEVSVSFPTTNLMHVRVDVNRTAGLFFAKVFGRDTAAVTAFAVAEAFPVSQRVQCVVPWGIPAPWGDSNHNGLFDPGEQPHWPPVAGECGPNDTSPPPTVWDYATHSIVGAPSTRDQYMCQGSLQVLKISDPQDVSVPGNFYGLDLSSLVNSCPEGVNINAGANFFKYMIKNSCLCDLKVNVGDTLPTVTTEPGNMVGPTLQATAPDSYFSPPENYPGQADYDSLMNADPGAYWDTATNMPVSTDSRYAGVNWSKSPRVVRIPVYSPDVSSGSPPGSNTPDAGRSSFQPLGFVGFWVQDIVYQKVQGKDLGTIVGRFITVSGLGSGEGSDPGNAGTPVLNIRLVQ